MAIKLGAENKRNVAIAGALFCVLAYLGISQLFSGPSTPPAHTTPQNVRNDMYRASGPPARTAPPSSSAAVMGNGPAARKLAAGEGLDPALHLERLALSESIEYAGSGRNIFSADSAPVQIEAVTASARPATDVPVVTGPPPPPQPPAIDLRYFGYSASKDGRKEAFLMHGEDIFEAAAGEIVNHRYKVVAVDQHSIQVTDLSYNNTQTLPLVAN